MSLFKGISGWKFAGLATLALVVASAFVAPQPIVADTDSLSAGDIAFGGIILAVIPCTMTTAGSPGLWILTYDFRTHVTLPIVYILESRLNEWFAPIELNDNLGTFMPIPGTCTISLYDYEPYLGFITPFPYAGMGTTLLPPELLS